MVVAGAVSTSGNWAAIYALNVNTGGALTSSDTVSFNGGNNYGYTMTGTGTASMTNVVMSASTGCGGTAGNFKINGVLTVNGASTCSAGMTMQNGSSMTGTGVLSVGVLTINGTVTSDNPTNINNGTLTVNAGASFTNSNTLTMTNSGILNNTAGGAVSLNNLTCTNSGHTINGNISIGGVLTVNGSSSTYSQASGTTTMGNGSSMSNVGTITFYNLNIPSGASLTGNTNFTVTSSAQFGSGSTFTPSSGTATFSNGGYIENSGGTVTFSGLTFATNAAVASSGSFGVSGTMTVNAGAVFAPKAGDVVSGVGTLTGTGTVKVLSATGTNDLANQYSISNKTLSGLTVDYTGTNQGIDNVVYGTLKFSGSNTNPATLTATNLTVPAGGSFVPSSGTLTIAAHGAITQASTGVLTVQNITLADTASLSGNLGVSGTITIPAGGALEPTATTDRVSGSGTLTGQGTVYVYQTSAGLATQYTIANKDISQLTVFYDGGVYPDNNTKFYNLTINQTCCNLTANLNVTVNGTLRVPTGKYFLNYGAGAKTILNNATIRLEGTGYMAATDLIASSGASTITATGAGYVGGRGSSLLSIHVKPGTSLTFSAPVTFNGASDTIGIVNSGTLAFQNLTFETGLTAVSGSSEFQVNGVFNNKKTAVNTVPGTITMNDGSTFYDQTANASYTNVTVAAGASVTASGSFPVVGTLTVNTGGTLSPNANTVISGAGTLTGTGTVKVSKATGTNDFAAQYSISNKTMSGLTVDFAGNGSDIDDLTYGSLKVSGSVTAATNPIVNGQLVVTGTLAPSTGSVSFGNGANIANTGSLTFYNVDIPAATVVTSTGNFATGNLFKVDGTFTPGVSDVLSGACTLSGTGRINVTRTGSSVLTGQYAVGALDVSGLNVDYYGSGAQGITPLTYKNLQIDNPNVSGVASVSGTFSSVYQIGDANTKIEMTGSGWSMTGFPIFNKFSVDTTPTSQPEASFSIAQNGTLTVEGSAVLAPTSGTLTLYPGVTFSGAGTLAPYSLRLTGSGTTTLPANLTVGNTLIIDNGHTLNLGTGTLTFSSQNPSITNNGAISGSSGTIEFAPSGTGGTTLPAFTFYGTMKVNKSANTFVVSPGTLTVGALDVAAGTLDLNSNAVQVRTRNVTISGTLAAPQSGRAFTVTGDWTNNGTFTDNGGTVTFEPSSDAATIQGSATTEFYGLQMVQPGKTLKVKAGTILDVDGILNIGGLGGNPAFLRSDTAGQTFALALASPMSANYLAVKDIACDPATATLTLGENADIQGNAGTCVAILQRGGGGSAFAPAGGEEGHGHGTPTGGGTQQGGGATSGSAADTGLLSPSSTGAVYNQWSNPTYAYSSNNQWALGNEYSWVDQDWGSFGASIPGGSTVDGITVNIEYKDAGECIAYGCEVDAYLSYDGGAHWSTMKSYYNLGNTTDLTQTLGGVSDKWGRSWSASEIANGNFLVRIHVGPNLDPMPLAPHQLYVDQVQVKVNYTTPATGGGAAQESPTPTPQPPSGGGGDVGGGGGAAP
jgi:hypothetical protein